MIILSKGGQGVEDAFQLSFVFTSVMASTAFSHALDWKSFHAVKAYILSHALLPRPGGFSVALSHNPPKKNYYGKIRKVRLTSTRRRWIYMIYMIYDIRAFIYYIQVLYNIYIYNIRASSALRFGRFRKYTTSARY